MTVTRGVVAHLSPDWYRLVDTLAERWRSAPLGPFETETVVVSSVGAGRLLAQHLAVRMGEDGVCAGVRFVTMGQLWREVDGHTADEPWRARALIFHIMAVLPGLLVTPDFAVVAHHLGPRHDERRPARWLGAASRFASMLLGYATDQPALIRAWNRGEAVDATGSPLPADARWQYALWCALTAAITAPDPVTRRDALLASGNIAVTGRVQVFAPTLLTDADVQLISALSSHQRLDCYLIDTNDCVDAITRVATSIVRDGDAQAHRPSVELHATHGPHRQVEVLRDALTAAFEDDPSLQPRDVLVVCPDIVRYAPLVRAAFAPATGTDAHPAHQLRVQVAASALSERNEVLTVLAALLRLADSRAHASDLIDLCSSPALAYRWGFGERDLERIAELVRSANVRWGIDAPHRARFGLDLTQNTWIAGLDQLLAGLAMTGEDAQWLGTVLPNDTIASSDADLLGRVAELVSRIRRFMHLTSEPLPMRGWVETLRETIELMVDVPFDDSWMLHHAWDELATLAERASGADTPISRTELAALFEQFVRARPGRPNYGNGSLLLTHLGDLTHVPHRIVCLLGLQERPSARRYGDRLPAPDEDAQRAAQRAQWWQALSAASERAIVVYQGHDDRTGDALPQPVLLTRLTDAMVSAGWQIAPTRHHPLHAHSPANFLADAPFSFDARMLRGAIASQHPSVVTAAPALEPITLSRIGLDELTAFLAHPASYFLSQRVGIATAEASDESEQLPISPTGLDRWAIGDRVLRLVRSGLDLSQVLQAEWRRGTVGPQQFGRATLDDIAKQVSAITRVAGPTSEEAARPLDLDTTIGGIHLDGRLLASGTMLVSTTFGKTDDRAWLAAWLQLLLASAAGSDVNSALLVGSPDWVRDADPVATSRLLRAPEPASARALLAELVELYREGLDRVLPLPRRCAREFANRARRYREPVTREQTTRWIERSWRFEQDGSWARFFPTLGDLLAEPGRTHASSRFAELALRVYRPMIEATEVTHHD